MSSPSQTALASTESAESAELAELSIPDARLRPVSRSRELVIVLGIYFASLALAFAIGGFVPVLSLVGLGLAFVVYMMKRRRDLFRMAEGQRELLAASTRTTSPWPSAWVESW